MASRVVNNTGSCDLTHLARHELDARLSQMRSWTTPPGRGPSESLFCVDHLYPLGLLPQFYQIDTDAPERLKEEEDFIIASQRMIKSVTSRLRSNISIDDITQVNLGTILYELISNTHYWAREDPSGVDLDKSVRGVSIAMIVGTRIRPLDRHTLPKPLCSYLEQQVSNSLYGGRYLEVSVFDTGPGFFQRWIGHSFNRSDTLDTELAVLRRCLAKHSSRSMLSTHGVGLHLVLRTLSNVRGFLLIRSGRLCVFRDLASHSYEAKRAVREPFLLDWHTNSRIFTQLLPVEGVVLTMIIPIHDDYISAYV